MEEIICINHESAMASYWGDAGEQYTFWTRKERDEKHAVGKQFENEAPVFAITSL